MAILPAVWVLPRVMVLAPAPPIVMVSAEALLDKFKVVAVLATETVPSPVVSRFRAPMPLASTLNVPLEAVPCIEIGLVPPRETLPAALTLNLDVGAEPACRSIRLPEGVALVSLAKIRACPAAGLPLAVTVSAELVLVPLSNLRTPEAIAELELVKT